MKINNPYLIFDRTHNVFAFVTDCRWPSIFPVSCHSLSIALQAEATSALQLTKFVNPEPHSPKADAWEHLRRAVNRQPGSRTGNS